VGVIRDTLYGVSVPSEIVGVRRHLVGDPLCWRPNRALEFEVRQFLPESQFVNRFLRQRHPIVDACVRTSASSRSKSSMSATPAESRLSFRGNQLIECNDPRFPGWFHVRAYL
jgi:hypothetical protein